MVGWVDKELAPEVADTLRRFKVLICELSYLSVGLVFSPSLVGEVSWRRVCSGQADRKWKLIPEVPRSSPGGVLPCARGRDRHVTYKHA